MFDHVAPLLPAGALAALPPPLATAAFDPSLPFALTTPNLHPAAALSGTAQPVVLARFSTLAEAMEGAISAADALAPEDGTQILDGSCEFGPLPPGDYYLAVATSESGTLTLPVVMPDDGSDVDLDGCRRAVECSV